MNTDPPLLLFGRFEETVHVHGLVEQLDIFTLKFYCQGVFWYFFNAR